MCSMSHLCVSADAVHVGVLMCCCVIGPVCYSVYLCKISISPSPFFPPNHHGNPLTPAAHSNISPIPHSPLLLHSSLSPSLLFICRSHPRCDFKNPFSLKNCSADSSFTSSFDFISSAYRTPHPSSSFHPPLPPSLPTYLQPSSLPLSCS